MNVRIRLQQELRVGYNDELFEHSNERSGVMKAWNSFTVYCASPCMVDVPTCRTEKE
jgi:hypothetical protein